MRIFRLSIILSISFLIFACGDPVYADNHSIEPRSCGEPGMLTKELTTPCKNMTIYATKRSLLVTQGIDNIRFNGGESGIRTRCQH